MKTIKMLFAACAAVLMSCGAFAVPTKYPIATVSADKTTLTFTTAPLAPLGVTAYYWMNSGDFERDEDGYPKWHAYASDITTVVFASGFASAEPTDCSFWFAGLTNLVTVTDLSNLNTALVTDMASMFENCSALERLDITSLKTSLVENMFGMFSGCSSLMMLNVKGFHMANVGDMGEMFKDCTSLRRIIGPMKNIDSGADSASMFEGCTALVGGSGTEYDAESIGKEYACVDMADGSTPGYFSYDALAIYDASAKTLTFYYDNVIHPLDTGDASYSVTAEDIADPDNSRAWSAYDDSITTVVFNESFKNYKPLHCGNWFSGFTELTTVSGIANLDTSMAEDMRYIFYYCSSLTSLDVSGFDTWRVKNMSHMFDACELLTTLDVYGFDTAQVSDMSYMFNDCAALTDLDVSGFDTSSVTTMRAMFSGCTVLPSLSVSQFDTENVVDMGYMFYSCGALTELDLSGFDTFIVTDMESMFSYCSNLKKIYVGDFYTDLLEKDDDMFGGCSNLVGEKGTAYSTVSDPEKDGKKYACIDKYDAEKPGYFSVTPIAVLSKDGETLTFYADGNSHSGEGGIYSVLEASNADPTDTPPWYDAAHEDVTTVVFDSSFANYKPKHCGRWFYMFSSLTTIEGIEYLDTSAAASFAYMFSDCSQLASVDVSKFNTSSVTDTEYMFYNCKELTELDLSSFDMSKVTSMKNMFSYCEHLENINLLGWNTAKCTNMNSMFKGCSSLQKLNLSGFNTAAVTDMTVMFKNCSELVTIYAPNFSLKTSVKSQEIFTGCAKLTGDHGTGYLDAMITANYARQDGGTGNKGYFSVPPTAKAVLSTDGKTLTFYYDTSAHSGEGTSYSVAAAEAIVDPETENVPWYADCEDIETVEFDSSFAGYRPTQCARWFYGFAKLTDLAGIGNLNTSRATSLAYMFFNCPKLEILDLRGLKTSNVTSMQCMFHGCEDLKTLWVDFDTRNVASMSCMFTQCDKLTDLDLRTFDLRNVSDTTDMFEDCTALKRIRNLRSDTPELTDVSYMFKGCAALEMIDLTAFDTKNVTSMASMFEGCSALEWIFASDKFVTTSVSDPGESIFGGCVSLKGFAGTAFNAENVSATYARIDATGTSGYLSRPPVAVLTSTSMTFYFDDEDHSLGGTEPEYSMAEVDDLDPDEDMPWDEIEEYYGVKKSNITTVEFDASFAKFKPHHCAWFYNFTAMNDVRGLQNLDVSHATSLEYMFGACNSLESVDLSSFDTANVKRMGRMFFACTSLKRIYVSTKFVTTGLDDSYESQVFSSCNALVGGNDTSYASREGDGARESAKYACIDAPGTLGYFTLAGPRTVTFDACGGTAASATLTPTVDTAIGTLPTAERAGYEFNGWFTAAEGGEAVTAETIITKDVTFYAQWSKVTYSISYELNGGVNAAANPTSYTVESAKITLAAPTREGYLFKGWSDGGVIAAGSTGDKTFTASWEAEAPSKHLVSFDPNGGEVGETARQIVDGDVIGDLPSATRTGYALKGWYTAAEGGTQVTADKVITADIAVYAQWQVVAPGKKVVTFDPNGGGMDSPLSREVTVGDQVGTLPTPSRLGYDFVGWFTASEGGEAISASTVVTVDLKIYAHWTPVEYTISYNLNGGVSALANPASYTIEDAVVLAAPTREGYLFKGWSPDNGNIPLGSTGNLAFTANWEEIVATLFTVTFDPNGGSVGTVTKQVADNDPIGALPTPNYAGHVFLGWYTAETGGTKLTEITLVTADITVYAQWQVVAPGKKVVTFDPQGGVAAEQSRPVDDGAAVGELPVAAREGYDFLGWYTEPIASTGVKVTADMLVTDDVTVYACWNLIAFTVLVDGNGGAVSESSRSVEPGQPIGTLPTATRFGYAFGGWFEGSGSINEVTPETVVDHDMTIHAAWTPIAYSIAYNLNGGENAAANPTSYSIESPEITLAAPTRQFYSFTGWTPDGGVIPAGSSGDLVFTANWVRVYPTLFGNVTGGAINEKGAIYNGFLGEGTLGGTFTLVVKKPKNGVSSATLTKVDVTTGKKVKITGTVNAETGVCAGDLAGVVLNAKGIGGTLGGAKVQGAVDASKAKDKATIAEMDAFNKLVYALALRDGDGNLALLTATFSKKGKVKVVGTAGSAKISGSAQMSAGEDNFAVPFAYSKKNTIVTFVLWFKKTGSELQLVDISGLGEGTELVKFGKVAAPYSGTYHFMLDADDVRASVPNAIDETPLDVAVVFNGKKYDAGKAAKVTYKKGVLTVDTADGTKPNVSGLALKYSKGTLSGSFTIYAIASNKLSKNKFTISGIIIDGVGYCSCTNKKLGSIAVELKK